MKSDELILFFNSVKVPLVAAGKEGGVLFWNSAASSYFGDQIKSGISILSLLDIDHCEFKKYVAENVSDDEFLFTGIKVFTADADKSADVGISVLKTGEDELLVVTVKDKISGLRIIPELDRPRSTIEDELKQPEEKLLILFESLPEGILVTDLDGNIIQVNRAYLRIFGYADRVMLSGKNIHEIFESAGDRIIVGLFSLAVQKGYSGVTGYELHRDEAVYIDIQALMISDEDGSPQGFLILAEDVTDRKRAEKALRESEARNRALVEAIPDIMFRMSNEGVYLDKMLGTKINEVFPPEVAVDAVTHIAEAIRTREIQIYEYPVTILMEERFYEARFVAIEDDEVLIIIRNTTEKRKALDEIENARREAELANRAKSEFLANMSHEIRTPLNSITGFIELLMRTGIDSTQREYLGIIRKSASSLLEIINDILDFSKIESHRLEISLIEFDPYTEFESVIRLFNVKAQEKGINLISFIDPLLPTGIISDPLRLKQIMSNFLSNAIKFTPEKGTVIAEIKLFRIKDDICMINFSVSDTGIGIPERKQKQIFEAFAQADSSVTRRYGGTGLGLSISSSLVRLLGSEIVLESRMGIGSKFYFTLEAAVSRERTMRDSFPCCQGLNAYIVSYSVDDIALLNIEYYLQSFGFNITFVPDFKRCRRERCDILFVINSADIRNDLAEYASLISSVPSILISGGSGSDSLHEMGGVFRHFLSQPLSPEILIRSAVNVIGIETEIPENTAEVNGGGELKFNGRVLVGEDNRINQKLMALLLRDYGVDVHMAGNGLDVFEMYKKGSYDLILMDINMPVADGIETARMIIDYENQLGLPHVPIIALTAKVMKRDMDTMSESGMDGYLSKPVEMDRLEEVLARYLTVDTVKKGKGETGSGDALSGGAGAGYDIKKVAAELKIPVNVLESIGRDFFEDLVDALIELRRALAESDFEMVRILSHKVKGAAANLRFVRVSEILAAVEENSSSGNKEFDYGKRFDDIEIEISALKTFF